MRVHEPFAATAARLPGKVALVSEGARHTYADMVQRIEELARTLAAHGVRAGDRVALFLDNGVELAAGVMAVSRLGAVFMPVNPLTKRQKLAWLLNDSRAVAMVTHAALAPAWQGALDDAPTVAACIVAGGGEHGARCAAYPAPGAALPAYASAPRESNDLAAIIYTSGSTGEPKGVMLSHANVAAAMRAVLAYLPLREDDVIHCVLPLSFGYGLYHWLMSAALGATLVLEAGFAFPLKTLQSMAAERATVFPGVPTIFAQWLNVREAAALDLTSLRIVTNAAAALSEEHLRRLRALLPGMAFYSMYGQTECKRVSYLAPDELDRHPGSVGRGMPFQEHWLAAEDGTRLPHGSTGELVVRGPHVMLGYWEKPGLTAARLRTFPGAAPGETALYTGDVFRSDAEGYLYFVARQDDIIKTRGEKVSPREVENALYELPDVLEAAVIGTPDEVLGTAVKAFLVLKPGAPPLTAREVMRHCHGRLESWMVPKIVEFTDSLPKTDNGKIRKAGLR